MTARRKTAPRRTKKRDPIEDDFGPGVAEEPARKGPPPSGPIPGLACAGDACVLKPVGDLLTRFAVRVVSGHGLTVARAATSGIELMKALRDFLDEEIALAEKASRGGDRGGARYSKIPVD